MNNTNKTSKNILLGILNNLTGENAELSEQRIAICKECPIFHKNFCIEKRGGCGCYLPWKTKVKEESCPIHKW